MSIGANCERPFLTEREWSPRFAWQAGKRRPDAATVDTKFTFATYEKHLGRDCAKVQIPGEVKPSSAAPAGMPMPMPIVHGRLTGELWMDTKLDMLVERKIVQDTATAFDMPVVHGDEGQTVAMKVKQKSTVRCGSRS